MNRTGIEYLDFSWNPIAMRCTPISESCTNCWHRRMAVRLKGNKNLPFDVRKAYAGEGPPVLVDSRLTKPMNKKKPAKIGVQFMGDLFHEDIPDAFIGKVFATMIATDWHTFQILTKRPKRMHNFVSWFQAKTFLHLRSFRHIWFGVSVENPDYLWRVEELLKIPAAIHFLSLEPLLGPVDIKNWLLRWNYTPLRKGGKPYIEKAGLSWCIVGGESGPRARPMHPDWARSIRDQCQATGVPFFMKQMSGRKPIPKDLMIREFPNGI